MLKSAGAALAAFVAALWSAVAFAAPPLDVYGQLPGFERASLSPSGDRYAVVGVLGDKRRLVVIEDGRGLLAVDLDDQKVNAVRWAGEDKILIHGSNTYALGPGFTVNKHEIDHVLVVNLATQEAIPLLTKGKAGNGVWGSYGVAQEDGRWYGYFGGITLGRSRDGSYHWKDGHPDLYRVDLDSGRERLVARGADGDDGRRTWRLATDGSILATFDFDRRSGAWRLRADKRGQTIVSGTAPHGGVGIVSQGRTPETIVYAVTDEAGAERWYEVPLAGGEPVEILADEAVVAPIEDRASGLLVGFHRAGDIPEPVFFDEGRQAKVRATAKAFPDLNMSLVSWNEAFDRLIVFTDGTGDSGTWWLVDLRSGKAEDIGRSYPAIKSADVGPIRMVSYTAADGLEMEGVLTLPPGREPKNLPLVVFPHGGPQARDYPQFDWWAQAFASRGYAVFQPNFRGSSGYSPEFVKAAEGEWGRKMQTDISDGVAELARLGIVDANRACIMGASYGGYAALAGVTLQNGLYRCAVSVAGVSDLRAHYNYLTDAYGAVSPITRNWKVDVGAGRELKDISPVDQAARADAPVLLIHGRDDTVVLVAQSKAMARALKRADKPVEFVELKGEDHDLARGESRLEMLRAAVAFVEKHNPAD